MGGKSSPPPAPDYAGAAQATAAGNLEATRAATLANRVNQVTPYGTVTWNQTPIRTFNQAAYDKAMADYQNQLNAYNLNAPSSQGRGDNGRGFVISRGLWGSPNTPTTATTSPIAPNKESFYTTNPDTGWTQTQSLSPEQQAIFNKNQQINQALGNVAQQGLGYVQTALNKPLTFDQMQQLQTPGQIQQAASDAAYQNAARYLDPQFAQSQASLENQLANQGITRGSEAYNTAMSNAAMQKEQAYNQARNQAYLQGLQGAGQAYQQGMGTRQQQINEAQTLQQNPINILNAIRSGQQMQVTQLPQQLNVPTQQATAGPDLLGAASATGQYNQGVYNAQQAGQGNMLGGLFGIGSSVLSGGAKPWWM